MGVGNVFCAEGLVQGGLFDVDAVEHGGDAGEKNDDEAKPIARMHGDCQESEKEA